MINLLLITYILFEINAPGIVWVCWGFAVGAHIAMAILKTVKKWVND